MPLQPNGRYRVHLASAKTNKQDRGRHAATDLQNTKEYLEVLV